MAIEPIVNLLSIIRERVRGQKGVKNCYFIETRTYGRILWKWISSAQCWPKRRRFLDLAVSVDKPLLFRKSTISIPRRSHTQPPPSMYVYNRIITRFNYLSCAHDVAFYRTQTAQSSAHHTGNGSIGEINSR